ncbi:hypothetical protein PLICRDRAFT_560212 [Plicaturopsis crispa FD-325 SS-3]|nr:hypothetical protein PLICRDRAFT_560212 [Plicaturopsis crispa FD-325 SS-3]
MILCCSSGDPFLSVEVKVAVNAHNDGCEWYFVIHMTAFFLSFNLAILFCKHTFVIGRVALSQFSSSLAKSTVFLLFRGTRLLSDMQPLCPWALGSGFGNRIVRIESSPFVHDRPSYRC